MLDKGVWVVGIGGIGSVVGYRLARAGVAPLLVDGWAAHVAAMSDAGLRLDGQFDDALVTVRSAALDDQGAADSMPDIVFLCVKSFQTETAVAKILPHTGPCTIVVSLQNGMNEERIAAAFGRERTVGGVVVMDGALLGPGVARQQNPDERAFTLGSLNGAPGSAVEDAAEVLRGVGEVRISDNVWGELWSKLVHNCMVNAVCALTGQNAACALRDPVVWSFARALGREAVRVSRAEGVVLGASAMFGCEAQNFLDEARVARLEAALLGAYPLSEDIHPSMAQDVAKGRPTEIDFLNGWIVDRGREAGIATPANARIVDLIRRVERGVLLPATENHRLLAEAPNPMEAS